MRAELEAIYGALTSGIGHLRSLSATAAQEQRLDLEAAERHVTEAARLVKKHLGADPLPPLRKP